MRVKPDFKTYLPGSMAEAVTRLQEDLKMPAALLARLLGVDAGSLSNWKSGKFPPNPESCVRLALVAAHDGHPLAMYFLRGADLGDIGQAVAALVCALMRQLEQTGGTNLDAWHVTGRPQIGAGVEEIIAAVESVLRSGVLNEVLPVWRARKRYLNDPDVLRGIHPEAWSEPVIRTFDPSTGAVDTTVTDGKDSEKEGGSEKGD